MSPRRCILFFLLLSLGVAGIPITIAQDNGQESAEEMNWDVWTPELQMRYRPISGVQISHDGRYVAYVVRDAVMEGEKSEFLSHIWIAATDGSFDRQFTHGDKSATNPSFSPDGKVLAFTSSRGGKKSQIWIIPVDGGEAYKVTDAKNGVGSYKWSPDGARIAYTMTDPQTKEEEKQKKEKRDVILVDKNFKYAHIYTTTVWKDEDGKRHTKRLTGGEFHVLSFDWSPDGKTIAFAHQPDPRINNVFLEQDISTVPSDSGAVTPLIDQPGIDGNPSYSPNGRSVAFRSQGGSTENTFFADVYVVASSGGKARKLAETHDRNPAIYAWIDDEHLLYAEYKGTTRNLFSLPLNGDAPTMLSGGTGNIGSAAFDRESEQVAFTHESTESPREVYISDVDRYRPTKLSSVNEDLPMPEMGSTEVISWTSPDGTPIEGLLTYPVGYESGRRYPLILNVHGGPAGIFSQGFTGAPSSYMLQTFAQQGFAIIRPNPRGSSGYGKDFRLSNFKDWGFGDYEDLMAGVDKVIEMGVGHEDSLCLMGWSYGGYMTSFAVTRTDRFKVASMGAGLPNLISMATTTDIPDFMVAHFGSEFWESYETFEKHSAIYRIKNVKTPTQVIHGQNDLRVPFTQGQEFYVALKRLGVPTEMIVYPRTPHGPREPKFVQDVTGRILKWFDRHLGRSGGL